MAKKVSLRNTKNDIFKAYQEAVREAAELAKNLKGKDSEINRLQKTASSTKTKVVISSGDSKSGDIDNMGSLIAALHKIQGGVGTSVSQIANKQIVEAESIEDLQSQISEEITLAKELYDVEVGNGTLLSLINNYEDEKKTFEENFNLKKKNYSQEREEKNTAWDKEQDDYYARINERDDEAKKTRKRETDEYKYKLKQDRALEDDGYAQKQKLLQEELDAIKNQKSDEWELLEKATADKETEFEEYKEKYDGLEEKLNKEIKKAEAEGKGVIERDHKVKMKLYKADIESDQLVLDLQVASLQHIIDKQETQLEKLNDQLTIAYKQAQHLAVKALEGSTNTESFNAIREIAMEQAKNSSKSK
ncbi:MAG: hypothetical protein GY810_03440 [Aureispira sp.]|nr:hypothetical protein [Aureispira sp.]